MSYVRDTRIIRGDTFEFYVGLAAGWEEVSLAPEDYEGRFVVRDRQDDLAPEDMVLTSPPLPGDDPRFPAMTHLLHFHAAPEVTQALPDWRRLVCYCELRRTDGTWVKRLFDGPVAVRD